MAPSKPRTPLAPHCSGDLIGGGTRSCPPVAMPLTATCSCPAQGALWPAVTPSPTRSTVIRVSPCRLTLCSERVRPQATGWMGSGVSRPPPVSALPGRSLRCPRPPSRQQDQKSTRKTKIHGVAGTILSMLNVLSYFLSFLPSIHIHAAGAGHSAGRTMWQPDRVSLLGYCTAGARSYELVQDACL